MVTRVRDQDVFRLTPQLEKAMSKYGVGSILNVKDEALPLEKWHDIIRKIQRPVREPASRFVIYGIDSITAHNYERMIDTYPQEIGMAATWNPP